jgi:hypothetical protein
MASPEPAAAYLFLLRYYPTVAIHLASGASRTLSAHMTSVITRDDTLRKLEQANPAEQIYFGNDELDSDRSPVWHLTGMSEPAVLATSLEAKWPDLSREVIGRVKTPGPFFGKPWILGAEPFNWLMTMVIKWYHENGGEQDTRKAVMFLTLHFYSSLVFKYYTRQGGYQKEAMSFAMNSLSDKFTLKQEGNMFKMLMAISWRSHQKYASLLGRCSDKDIFDYFISLRNRINGPMRTLFVHYLDVRARGAYLNTARDTYDTGEHAERNTDSGRILALTDKLTQSFVGEPPPERAISLASQMSSVPPQTLRGAVTGMRAREGTLIREIIQLILEVFFEEKQAGPDDLKTRAFLAFAVALYARSNTKDGRIERIKSILDQLLLNYSEQYTRTERAATKGAFRRCLFLFFVLHIQIRS